ncbi:ABC transporter ATP-binding protein [Saccharothrix violaceirubra]|uniref:Energy-coupling factor transporter ATP-binding protein EcfA2 n=1 Tax=Saccharothrix violaceirubra TaxID=413306 RepID=A0A7W7T2T5_9PSEU|nr:hypothetical protein [Saccharothrix violaceirubra]MBB4964305.1 energy-coupling factor transporter ATP-binding protein EcfA2 [Saccharothrix violaceirubra]
MQIRARAVGVTGAHGPLLEPTSLVVPPGTAVLVAGDPGTGHTALALVLAGRLRPTSGQVWPDPADLRRHVVPVDLPDVNEPEASLTLAGVVGEELAVNGLPSGRRAVADWLADRDADAYLKHRFDRVPPAVRCAVTLELAAGRPDAAVLVLDSPDRYHGDPAGWWALARAHVTPDRSVVVLCATTSAAALDVPAVRIGDHTTDGESE